MVILKCGNVPGKCTNEKEEVVSKALGHYAG